MNKINKYALLAVFATGFALNASAQPRLDLRAVTCGALAGGLTAKYTDKFSKWLLDNPEAIFMAAVGMVPGIVSSIGYPIGDAFANDASFVCAVASSTYARLRGKTLLGALAITAIPYIIGLSLGEGIN